MLPIPKVISNLERFYLGEYRSPSIALLYSAAVPMLLVVTWNVLVIAHLVHFLIVYLNLIQA